MGNIPAPRVGERGWEWGHLNIHVVNCEMKKEKYYFIILGNQKTLSFLR